MVDLVTRFATLVISIVGLLFPIVLRFSTFIVKVKLYVHDIFTVMEWPILTKRHFSTSNMKVKDLFGHIF